MTRTHWMILVFLLFGAGAIGALELFGSQEDPDGPQLVAAAATTPPTDTEDEDTPPVAEAVPTIDAFSHDADGLVVIAGRAENGATVEVVSGDEVLGDTVVGADGAFVVFATVPASDVAQALFLRSSTGDGMTQSAAPILIPPSEPLEVAAADSGPSAGALDVSVEDDTPENEALAVADPVVVAPEDAPLDDVAAVFVGEPDEGLVEAAPTVEQAEVDSATIEPEPVEEVAALEVETDIATPDAPLVSETGDQVAAVAEPIEEAAPDADVLETEAPATLEDAPVVIAEVEDTVSIDPPQLPIVEEAPSPEPVVETESVTVAETDVPLAPVIPQAELSGDEVAELSVNAPVAPVADAVVQSGVQVATAVTETETLPQVDLPQDTVDLSVLPLGVDTQPAVLPQVQAEVVPDGFDTAETAVAAVVPPTQGADDDVARTGLAQPATPVEDEAPADTPTPEVAADVPELAEPSVDTAPAQLPVLLADPSGVRVLQPALAAGSGEDVLRTVALDTISYDAAGDVQVGGRASGGGHVRVYLNNALLTEVAVNSDGTWGTSLTEVDTGIYMMRVDQVAASGEVISRIETPFQREERAVIAAILSEDLEDGQDVAIRTVQAGNTLWGISQEQYGEGVLYVRVFEANRDLIRDPNLIYPGQILRIPTETGVQD